ncbi:MAG: hypothetical protein ACXWIZ_11955 [Caldimonas sp.]
MSGEVRIDRIELDLEALSAAEAQVVADALPGALAGQMALWPLPQPRSVGRLDRGDMDLDAIAEEIAARILEIIAVERQRNDEDASWH